MAPKDQYTTVKKAYLRAFEKIDYSQGQDAIDLQIKDRKLAARNVVTTIVEDIYFETPKIIEEYTSINTDIVEKVYTDRSHPYGENFNQKLFFLCDFGHIHESLKAEYAFINSEGGQHSLAHLGFKNGEERLLYVIKIFLNEILESFLADAESQLKYLIPMHVIEEENPKLFNKVINRIETFKNIRKDKQGFAKYRTVMSYIFGFLLAILLSVAAIPIAIIGILNTKKFVFDKVLKRKRYATYGFILLLAGISMSLSFYINEQVPSKGIFNFNVLGDKGFMVLSQNNNPKLSADNGLKTLSASIVKKGETMEFNVLHAFQNMGHTPINDGIANMKIIEQEHQILINRTS